VVAVAPCAVQADNQVLLRSHSSNSHCSIDGSTSSAHKTVCAHHGRAIPIRRQCARATPHWESCEARGASRSSRLQNRSITEPLKHRSASKVDTSRPSAPIAAKVLRVQRACVRGRARTETGCKTPNFVRPQKGASAHRRHLRTG
jgi:hypothetical protein